MPSPRLAFSSLIEGPRLNPDHVRIAALSAATALNLAVLMVVLRPLAPVLTRTLEPMSLLAMRLIEPPAPAKPITPPMIAPPRPHPIQAAPTQVAPAPVAPPTVMALEEGTPSAPLVSQPTTAPPAAVTTPAVTPSPVETILGYRQAPLHFPTPAIRQHLHGTVVLRVLVDIDGKPLEVVIDQTSGHAARANRYLPHGFFNPLWLQVTTCRPGPGCR